MFWPVSGWNLCHGCAGEVCCHSDGSPVRPRGKPTQPGQCWVRLYWWTTSPTRQITWLTSAPVFWQRSDIFSFHQSTHVSACKQNKETLSLWVSVSLILSHCCCLPSKNGHPSEFFEKGENTLSDYKTWVSPPTRMWKIGNPGEYWSLSVFFISHLCINIM